MHVSKKLIVVLSILFTTFFLMLVAFFVMLYKPQIITSILFKGNFTNTFLETNRTENETLEIYNVKSVIKRNLVKLREGINYHQALILKVRQEENSTHAYLVSTDPMEWEFVKGTMEGGVTFKEPVRVLKCKDVYVLDFDITGMWIPQISRGTLTGKGFITSISMKGVPEVKEFEGKCLGSGFIFNKNGELYGICIGDKIILADEIFDLCPDNCKLIYLKEVKDENLQGENGLLVR